MIDTLHGSYKLAKQTGGTAHFARVTIRVKLDTTDQITFSAPGDSIRGWKDAVLAGAEAAIVELKRRNHVLAGISVDICDFVGIVTDTTDDDAKWATFMAVFSAFSDALQPTLEFAEHADAWVLSWGG